MAFGFGFMRAAAKLLDGIVYEEASDMVSWPDGVEYESLDQAIEVREADDR